MRGNRTFMAVCRGGIYASRQGCAPRKVYGKYGRFPRFVGRAISPAEPMIFSKNFIMFGGVCARRRVSDWRRSAVSERNRAARPGS